MEWVKTIFFSRSYSKSYDETNGLTFNDVVLPEEIILMILSNLDLLTILKSRLVCKRWNEFIQSQHFWRLKLAQKHINIKNKHPWYAYYTCYAMFDKNLLQNCNGEEKFNNWKSIEHGGDGWKIEDPPVGADKLPKNVPEFRNKTSCFSTSYITCKKLQVIDVRNNPVLKEVLNECQPTIYISEWFAGRFDCGCYYKLGVRLYDENGDLIHEKEESRTVMQWAGKAWEKVELKCDKYGQDVCFIEFYHEGSDTQFWAGNYGSKMAGGVVKLLFDFI